MLCTKFLLPLLIFPPGAWLLIHETRRPHPLWKRSLGHPLNNKHLTKVPLRFALRQQNIGRLHDELLRVSDPSQSTYGKHWTAEEVANFFSPAVHSKELVVEWLSQAGFEGENVLVDEAPGWIKVEVTIQQAELLLETTYEHYSNAQGGLHIGDNHLYLSLAAQTNLNVDSVGAFFFHPQGCEHYHLPDHVAPHVEMVLPTVHYPPQVHHQSTKRKVPGRLERRDDKNSLHLYGLNQNTSLSHCSTMMTHDCLRQMYNFSHYTSVAAHKNSFGLLVFSPSEVDYAGSDDLFQRTSPYVVHYRPRVHILHGKVQAPSNNHPDMEEWEAFVDFQYSQPFIYPLKVDVYHVKQSSLGDVSTFDPLIQAFGCTHQAQSTSTNEKEAASAVSQPCGYLKPPNVISISYGVDEALIPRAALVRQCNEYGKLGLMGVTVVVGSGDRGVASQLDMCGNPNGELVNQGGSRFTPAFPASCPYVTTVGATMLPVGASYTQKEVPLDTLNMRSGGGFSDVFEMPAYQKQVIDDYFAKTPPPYNSAQYNNSRKARAFPDLSLNGAQYLTAVREAPGYPEYFVKSAGTSVSTPVVASMIALINDARINAGMRTVGFINPSLYSPKFREAFTDIINGSNRGCETQGFASVQGWDPVTGFGTPKFDHLLKLWTK